MVMRIVHRWTRLSSTTWEDAWEERLRFVDPQQIAFFTWRGSHALKIEAYCSESTAKKLVNRFGGRVTKLAKHGGKGSPAAPREPLSIRGKLKIFSERSAWRRCRNAGEARAIFIPAGMAFGTGEHATTASCLRLLADITSKLLPDFAALDIGTGAGILAIGAKALGASRVKAIDYDPAAVRIAKKNAANNGFPMIEVDRGDALRLTERRVFDVVLANLLNDVLIAAAPRIARATKSGGWLIFSGVLREQVQEVASAFEAAGFSTSRILTSGNWCAGACQKDKQS
jgi:ribosomal protein L11 methyltransferase